MPTPETRPRDDPQASIADDRRRALVAGVDLPTRVRGAALFADISGSTPLTEALARELGPRRGADELSAVLETVFAALPSRRHAHGGNVIYFSGDAVTCWLDGDDGLRAVASGLEMQAAMAEVGRVVTPSGTVVQLAMKVAVAVGEARRFVVGALDDRAHTEWLVPPFPSSGGLVTLNTPNSVTNPPEDGAGTGVGIVSACCARPSSAGRTPWRWPDGWLCLAGHAGPLLSSAGPRSGRPAQGRPSGSLTMKTSAPLRGTSLQPEPVACTGTGQAP